MFKKGDFIFYGTIGVCQVTDIAKTDFSYSDRLYYYLVPLFEKNTTIYISVNNDKVTMRQILTSQEARQLIESWPEIDYVSYSNAKEQAQVYRQVLQSGDSFKLASVVKGRSPSRPPRKGGLTSACERDGRKMAQRLLFGELATALDLCPEHIPEYIQEQTGEMLDFKVY